MTMPIFTEATAIDAYLSGAPNGGAPFEIVEGFPGFPAGEYIGFPTYAAAGQAAAIQTRNDAADLVDVQTLANWCLGLPGVGHYRMWASLDEWLDDVATSPEEVFAVYDGDVREFVGSGSVAFRTN